MKSFIHKIYFHREKESNWELEDIAVEEDYMNVENLAYLGYEVEMEIEIFEDSSNVVKSINGIDVSQLGIYV